MRGERRRRKGERTDGASGALALKGASPLACNLWLPTTVRCFPSSSFASQPWRRHRVRLRRSSDAASGPQLRWDSWQRDSSAPILRQHHPPPFPLSPRLSTTQLSACNLRQCKVPPRLPSTTSCTWISVTGGSRVKREARLPSRLPSHSRASSSRLCLRASESSRSAHLHPSLAPPRARSITLIFLRRQPRKPAKPLHLWKQASGSRSQRRTKCTARRAV